MRESWIHHLCFDRGFSIDFNEAGHVRLRIVCRRQHVLRERFCRCVHRVRCRNFNSAEDCQDQANESAKTELERLIVFGDAHLYSCYRALLPRESLRCKSWDVDIGREIVVFVRWKHIAGLQCCYSNSSPSSHALVQPPFPSSSRSDHILNATTSKHLFNRKEHHQLTYQTATSAVHHGKYPTWAALSMPSSQAQSLRILGPIPHRPSCVSWHVISCSRGSSMRRYGTWCKP